MSGGILSIFPGGSVGVCTVGYRVIFLRFFMPDGYGRFSRELISWFCPERTGSVSVIFRSGTLLLFSGIIPLGSGRNGREKECFPAGSIRIRRPECQS